ncbi:MAG: TRAP transporter small permease [Ectothiorhodospiraceae bacterium]|nr:TRAP transporter small permease [Ectothiorhodospiraceae bacterium]
MRFLEGLERWLERFNGGLLKGLWWLSIATIAVMTVIVLAAVFFRYVLAEALPWSEEIAKFLMVWMTFLAAPIAYREGALVAVGALPDRLSGRLAQLLVIIVQLVVISVMVVFLKEGSFLTWNARIQTASTIELSISWVYVSMPLGAVALLSVSLGLLVTAIRELIRPSPPREREAGPLHIPGAM